MMYGNHMNGGGWVLSILVTLIIVALIVTSLVWFGRNRAHNPRPRDIGANSGSARELLDRRFASGEITPEEYQRVRETLSGTV
jgi:uncharacterized membrane protein